MNTQRSASRPTPALRRSRVPLFLALSGLAVLFITLVGVSQLPQNAPGQKTRTLEQQMKPMQMQSSTQFAAHFGPPQTITPMTVRGVEYSVWMYPTEDGTVQAWINKPLDVVEMVGSLGH